MFGVFVVRHIIDVLTISLICCKHSIQFAKILAFLDTILALAQFNLAIAFSYHLLAKCYKNRTYAKKSQTLIPPYPVIEQIAQRLAEKPKYCILCCSLRQAPTLRGCFKNPLIGIKRL